MKNFIEAGVALYDFGSDKMHFKSCIRSDHSCDMGIKKI
jgi:hypothetical protein